VRHWALGGACCRAGIVVHALARSLFGSQILEAFFLYPWFMFLMFLLPTHALDGPWADGVILESDEKTGVSGSGRHKRQLRNLATHTRTNSHLLRQLGDWAIRLISKANPMGLVPRQPATAPTVPSFRFHREAACGNGDQHLCQIQRPTRRLSLISRGLGSAYLLRPQDSESGCYPPTHRSAPGAESFGGQFFSSHGRRDNPTSFITNVEVSHFA